MWNSFWKSTCCLVQPHLTSPWVPTSAVATHVWWHHLMHSLASWKHGMAISTSHLGTGSDPHRAEGERTRHLGNLWRPETSCSSSPPQTSGVWRMSLLTHKYSVYEKLPDMTGDHYYNFGICNPLTSFLYMVFIIKVLEKVKVNNNMQKYLGLITFFSLFICLFSLCYFLVPHNA